MGRRPRIHFPGAIYHAIVRGNNRQPLFTKLRDHKVFTSLIADAGRRFDHRIHAFCWMSNHAHLMIQVDDAPLSEIIHNLCSRYARWFNEAYSRTGHVFERRYRAGLIGSDSAAMSLARYIHLNPVKAGLVDRPIEHPWSSHRSYLGMESVPWLETDLVLGLFSKQRSKAIEQYKAFTYAGMQIEDPKHEVPEADGLYGECVQDDYQPRRQPRESTFESARELLLAVCEYQGIEPGALVGASRNRKVSRARALLAYLARDSTQITFSEVGRLTGKDPSTFSHAAEQLARQISDDPSIRRDLNRIREIGQH